MTYLLYTTILLLLQLYIQFFAFQRLMHGKMRVYVRVYPCATPFVDTIFI